SLPGAGRLSAAVEKARCRGRPQLSVDARAARCRGRQSAAAGAARCRGRPRLNAAAATQRLGDHGSAPAPGRGNSLPWAAGLQRQLADGFRCRGRPRLDAPRRNPSFQRRGRRGSRRLAGRLSALGGPAPANGATQRRERPRLDAAAKVLGAVGGNAADADL
ncbi:hypothetical protein CYMTET_21096, partial [Cymbomonas tetramitiformis]